MTTRLVAVLGGPPRTAEYHKYGMMHALGLKSAGELTQLAIKKRLGGG